MKKYVYVVVMILYIGLSIVVIDYAANWMVNKNYSAFASKTDGIAILTVKNLTITNTEVEELEKLLGVDLYIDEYEKDTNAVRLLLLLVFLLPSVALTIVYILFYFTNLKQALLTAQTDPLTSVKNRRFMEKYMAQTIKEHYQKKQPLSVIMLDIDYFKSYNDNYGHQQGDNVLIAVTKAITSVLRNHTDVVCRYGGEEFFVILNSTNAPGAVIVANRIKTAIDNIAIKHEGSQVADIVTISQGIYSAIPASANSEKLFIENADKSMYKAKNTGRNKYVIAEVEERSQEQ